MANGKSAGAALGEALQSSSQNLLNFYIRQQQLDIQRSSAESLKAYREQAGALSTFQAVAPFMEPGKRVGEHAFVMEPIRAVLGETGAEDFAGMIVPSAEGSSILESAWNSMLVNMQENDPREFRRIVRAYGEQDALSKPLAEWTAGEKAAVMRGAGLDVLRETWNQPEARGEALFQLQNLARDDLGLPQQFRGILPNGNEVVYDSKDQATFLQTLNQFQWNQSVVNDQRITDMARGFLDFLTPQGGSPPIPLEEARALVRARHQGPAAMQELLSQRPDLQVPAAHLDNSLAIQRRQMEYMILDATAPVDPETGRRNVEDAVPYVTMWNVLESIRPDLDEATTSRAYKILGDMVNNKAGATVFPKMNPNGFLATITGGGTGSVEFDREPFAGSQVTMTDLQRASLQAFREGRNISEQELLDLGIPQDLINRTREERSGEEETSELFQGPRE